jgi:hypothetical protein
MSARARFTKSDVERALGAAANVGVSVAVLIQPDGSIAIVPAERVSIMVTANDLDDRLATFGAK